MGDEADLVARLQAGDEDAFAVLVRQHHTSLVRLATTIVGSSAVADEVVQDTWLAVVRGVERFEGRSSLKTWLFHILANRARSTASRERRTEPIAIDEGADRFDGRGHWSAPPEPWSDIADDRMVAERMVPAVRELLDDLPATQREVLVLRDAAGLATADVAAIVGVSSGNLRVLLHRARTRVRAGLEA